MEFVEVVSAAAAAVQIAQISSKPLPKYAKGRKWGGGELAWVGEQGPEVMFVPAGAAIVPAHKSKSMTPDVMKEYNIPIPPLPHVTEVVMRQFQSSSSTTATPGVSIDYEKLGSVIASKVPPQTSVNVNMDEVGFSKYLQRDNSKSRILNNYFRR